MNDVQRSLREEIEAFRQSQLEVYRAQPKRLQRDAGSVNEAIRDHVDRWPFELLQNAEDAGASNVVVRFTKDTVYFADNGAGLPAGTVESLSGTHLSEKPAGAIGRKGLGFKAVYCVSPNPAVFSGSEGLLFDREAAIQWMKDKGLSTRYVPYQWLPIWLSRGKEEQSDPVLPDLSALRTAIRLPIPDADQFAGAWQLMSAFNPETLLTFRHVRCLEVRNDSDGFNIELVQGPSEDVVLIHDSRVESAIAWRTVERQLSTPLDLLEAFEEGPDRDRVKNVGVRVAARMDENGHVVPLKHRPYLHVYYPTEELSPLRMLLHGDFMIKSDRTALVPLAKTRFNQWIAHELASLLVQFVADCFTPHEPGANLRLLLAPTNMRSEESRAFLWNCIVEEAKTHLLLPDADTEVRLKPGEALRLDLESGYESARQILQPSPATAALIHPALDEDQEASKVLESLDVQALGDSDVIKCIREHGDRQAVDAEWLWACWQWLADWAEEDEDRIDIARTLSVIPDNSGVISGSDAEDLFVTWNEQDAAAEYPDWLPLRFIADWFRDKLLAEEKDVPLRNLAEKLHIQKPTADIALKALARAAEEYWDSKEGDPSRFLRLVVETKWFETEECPESLGLCPVPARPGNTGQTWAPAQDAYFGEEWGDKRLAQLHEGNDEVFWALPLRKLASKKIARPVLQWLGVQACPRIAPISGTVEQGEERKRVIKNLRDYTKVGPIPDAKALQHVDIGSLPPARVPMLLAILAASWETYYGNEAHESVRYYYRSWNRKTIPCLWWEQTLTQLRPPVKGYRRESFLLNECWLANDKLERLSPLLPFVDLNGLSKRERTETEAWLHEIVKLRDQPEQLTDGEASEILKKRIPALIPESACSDRAKRHQVSRWYNATLDALQSRGRGANVPILSYCPLLCNKGDSWAYVEDEEIWLNDDNDAATAFKGEIWTISLQLALRDTAEQVLEVRPLSANKGVEFHWHELSPEDKSFDSGQNLGRLLAEVKPHLFAWVSHNRRTQDEMALKESMNLLKIELVQELKASIRLVGVKNAKDIPRAYAVRGEKLILDVAQAGESTLAKALAEALGRTDDADFYDVLLRCPSESGRRAKLVQDRNLPESELDRYLAEWGGEELSTEDLDGVDDIPPEHDEDQVPPGADEPVPPDEVPEEIPPGQEDKPRTDHKRRRKLRLKKSDKTPLVEISPETDGDGTGGGGGGGYESDQLTAEERALVEMESRTFVGAELEAQGYEIEQMPRENPGFDIRAVKPGSPTLLVEVKGHLGKSLLIDLTVREYEEYAQQISSSSVRWEIWNVQNLSSDRDGDVLFSRHSLIPEDAVAGVRQLRINLGRCPFFEKSN